MDRRLRVFIFANPQPTVASRKIFATLPVGKHDWTDTGCRHTGRKLTGDFPSFNAAAPLIKNCRLVRGEMSLVEDDGVIFTHGGNVQIRKLQASTSEGLLRQILCARMFDKSKLTDIGDDCRA